MVVLKPKNSRLHFYEQEGRKRETSYIQIVATQGLTVCDFVPGQFTVRPSYEKSTAEQNCRISVVYYSLNQMTFEINSP